ncbi:hypothetical protein PG994_005075 [Apiospora phragmitis]|uniref:Uncharacterized protein n=1 Tax=Apiospora phragmitis TaxID=2905665 RepID=A0ABR1VSD2_9PEZI
MAPTPVLITGANRASARASCSANSPSPTIPSSLRTGTRLTRPRRRWPACPRAKAAVIDQEPFVAVDELQQKHGIHCLDIVIANAGIAEVGPPRRRSQAGRPPIPHGAQCLRLPGDVSGHSASAPEVVQGAHIRTHGIHCWLFGKPTPIPNATYGPTKAVVSWDTIRINAEDDWLNAFILVPGSVLPDLGDWGARALGMERAFITVKESCDSMIHVLDKSSKEQNGGKMVDWNGDICPC